MKTETHIAPGQPNPSYQTREQCEQSLATRLVQAVCDEIGEHHEIVLRTWYNLPDNMQHESMDEDPTLPPHSGYVLECGPAVTIEMCGAVLDFLRGVAPAFDGDLSDDRISSAAAAIAAGKSYSEVREAGQLWCVSH